MVDLRKDKRAPASLKVKYKSASVDQFVEQFGGDVSRGGIFIKTKTPIEIRALLKLELQLSDASPVIHGVGRVCWRREPGPDPSLPAGMGIKFVKLDPSSVAIVERIVGARGESPSRFDQTQGAEIAPASIVPPRMSTPPTEPIKPQSIPAAPKLPSLRAPAVAKPNVAPAPRPPAPRAMAGLFADRRVSGSATDDRGSAPGQASFFPQTPSAAEAPRPPAPGRDSASPSRAGHTRDSSQFLAAAFTEAGVAEDTAKKARAAASAQQAGDDDLVDQLFAQVAEPSLLPPAKSSAPPIKSIAPQRAASLRPNKPLAETDVEDVFAALSDEEGLSEHSQPPAPAGHGSSVPSAPIASVPPSAEDVDIQADALLGNGAAETNEFGEAELSGAQSINAPRLPGPSLAPAPVAFQELAAPERSSPMLWIALVLVVGAGAGGYFYYQQHQQAERAAAKAEAQAMRAEAAQQKDVEAAPEATPIVPEVTGPLVYVEVETTSLPRGAEVWIDGKVVGITPTRLSLVVGKEAEVTVRSAGYASMTKKMMVTKPAEALRFKLEPLPYSLSVRTDPPGAELTVSGRTIKAPGPLDLEHLNGDILLNVAEAGFQRVTRPVRLSEFSEQAGVMRAEIEVRLSPLPGQRIAPPPAAPSEEEPKPRAKLKGKKPAAKPAPEASAEPAAAEPPPAAQPPAP